ncbi:protein tramtrack, alpha isoform isoform X1 [Drosophila montana]|uniref:protein tramtrack, alpha isoform isoform X1 n=1 Tax=Drosophila montana TaxID=40370 RepID=UPI00313F36B4
MKMASQRFCLRWNNHQSNLLSVFDQLLHAETFTDVTLAVEGQYLKAHKMVLSACSPYFNALFINHPEKHPIVILKDVPYSDMKSLLDFMYRGEVSVDQERLTAFLRVAESLRIKGLTEVNDDKPTSAESAPAPPQLQRIQPYLVPQQRKQPNVLAANAAAAALQAAATQQHQQQQPSLLSTALMPKRKRGRPRKLSGSSNGTGNDYDEFEREGIMNDSDMGNGKLCNESYSGNDDGSDDNQQESAHNDDLNESRDSLPTKRSKSGKDQRMAQQDDNSTSAQTATPELSQRLFGTSTHISPGTATTTTTTSTATTTESPNGRESSGDNGAAASLHLPTILGLKIRAINASNQPAGGHHNNNSLLKQQLRGGAKDPEMVPQAVPTSLPLPAAMPVDDAMEIQQQQQESSCSALQSLANAAERQAQQTPSSNNNNNSSNNSNNNNNNHNASLQQQLLLHMAAKADYYQAQQQQAPPPAPHASPPAETHYVDEELELLCVVDNNPDKCDETDHELLTLADENAGLPGFEEPPLTNNETSAAARAATAPATPKRPVQRRRVRRKAQSTLDDQAEHLTEMSVRGLDLFRYASVVEGVYRCTECAKENMQKTFKNKYSFQRHAFLYHEGKHRKVFPCPVCCKEFSRPDKMKNHLKMTHENFTSPKDIGAFSPLKYLISAAAAGDMHTNLYQQQQQQEHLQQQLEQQQQLEHQEQMQRQLEEHHQQQQQQQSPYDCQDNALLLPDVVKLEHEQDQDMETAPATPTAAAAAMLSLQHDVIIKNEIQISPSPSPSPPAMYSVSEGKSLPPAQTAT